MCRRKDRSRWAASPTSVLVGEVCDGASPPFEGSCGGSIADMEQLSSPDDGYFGGNSGDNGFGEDDGANAGGEFGGDADGDPNGSFYSGGDGFVEGGENVGGDFGCDSFIDDPLANQDAQECLATLPCQRPQTHSPEHVWFLDESDGDEIAVNGVGAESWSKPPGTDALMAGDSSGNLINGRKRAACWSPQRTPTPVRNSRHSGNPSQDTRDSWHSVSVGTVSHGVNWNMLEVTRVATRVATAIAKARENRCVLEATRVAWTISMLRRTLLLELLLSPPEGVTQ